MEVLQSLSLESGLCIKVQVGVQGVPRGSGHGPKVGGATGTKIVIEAVFSPYF